MKPGEGRDRLAEEWIGRTHDWARRRGARWPAAADDIEAEAYYQLALAVESHDPEKGDFGPRWYYAMANAMEEVVRSRKPRGYKCRDFRDRDAADGPRLMEYGNPEIPPDDFASADAGLARVEDADELSHLMADLDPFEARSVVRRYVHGLTIPELAADLGCCPKVANETYLRAARRMARRAQAMQQEQVA